MNEAPPNAAGRLLAAVRARGAWLWIAAAVALLARAVVARVLGKVGHAGAPLDDAYIHFQYARAIAEGHPFRFQAGAPATSGGTSLAWPAVLAPFWAIGFRDEAIVWPAWALSFAALGALAFEIRALVRGLAGEMAAVGAATMVLAFPAFAWFAASGMEVLPFAWLLARSARRASEWCEGERSGGRRRELVLLAWGATMTRPEGALASAALACVLLLYPLASRGAGWRGRSWGLLALAPIAAQPLLLLAVTGSAQSSTAVVKLLPGNPYYAGPALAAAIEAQARSLAGTLLNGQEHSLEFLPSGGAWLAFAGLAAIGVQGARAGRGWRAGLTIALALAVFVPCAYSTFLWNRLRYLWPFASGWIAGLACLARVAGDTAALVTRRGRAVTPIACGAVAGMFLMRMDWTIEDVAQSASGIDRQQVALGRWAREGLPGDARVGVNDTGAIAYFGDRQTFDVVGLTSRGEGRYWVAGVGSRLEHYERLHAADPSLLPTHFIVYPEWFGIDALLGQALEERTVTDATILGGGTMRAYEADYSALGSGEAPWTPLGEAVDALDVADLESEAGHAYELLGARDGWEVATEGPTPDGRTVLDGGRAWRTRERFVAHLRDGERTRAIVRLEAPAPAMVRVVVGGREVAMFLVEPPGWVEAIFNVPAGAARRETAIELAAEAPVTVYHYWFGAVP